MTKLRLLQISASFCICMILETSAYPTASGYGTSGRDHHYHDEIDKVIIVKTKPHQYNDNYHEHDHYYNDDYHHHHHHDNDRRQHRDYYHQYDNNNYQQYGYNQGYSSYGTYGYQTGLGY